MPLPASILLATDLGARCDRALSRAILLARRWNARLVAVTVAPAARTSELQRELLPPPAWARRETPADDAERDLRRSLEGCGVEVEVRVESGEIGPSLLRIAQDRRCGLIVTGIGRGGWFAPSLPGSTIGWLSRHASQPLLVVRQQALHDYRHLAFASDFSPAAGRALAVAAGWFGSTATEGALVHGVDIPAVGRVDAGSPRAALVEQTLDQARIRARAALAEAALPPSLHGRVATVVEHAEPARLLREYARTYGADLVAIGSHGRSALSDVLLGSVAQRILETTPCDVLVVRGFATG